MFVEVNRPAVHMRGPVVDMDHFTESGGMIQFVMEAKRVRFVIDVGASSRARLKVSSKLLSLARTVTGREKVWNN